MTATLVLTRRDVAALLTLPECIAAVERALLSHAAGNTLPPGVLGVHSGSGGFHVKAAGLLGARGYFAAKCNANFPENPERHGLPAIQGVIVLCDAQTGALLALLDSIEITIQRTGAATAVAARHFARSESRVAAICGCGNQGRVQLRALMQVLPLREARVFDRDAARSRSFAAEMHAELGIEITAAGDVMSAVRGSDVCVTCTPSRRAFLTREHVSPGCFVAAVGADNPQKQELDPALLAASTIVVDLLEQCATMGDLHHALRDGVVTKESVHAELHEVVAGRKPGRRNPDEVVVFDSTGIALQDVAAAALVYEKALAQSAGSRIDLSS